METGVAAIAVEHLVRLVVVAAETNLAISFKKFFRSGAFDFSWFELSLTIYELL